MKKELAIQAECVTWFRNEHERHGRGFIFHVPNEGKRSGIGGQILKAIGLRPGFPDLVILLPGRAVLIEMKTSTGVVRTSQKRVHAALLRVGYPVHVARSLEEFQGVVAQELHLAAHEAPNPAPSPADFGLHS